MSGTPPPPPAPTPPGRRGVIARLFPDWHAEDACVGIGSVTSGIGNNPLLALVNNDQKLRSFLVYGLSITSITANQNVVVGVDQNQSGITNQFTVPIVSSPAQPVGGMLAANAGNQPTNAILIASVNPTPFNLHLDRPLGIVDPGGQFSIVGTLPQSNLRCWIWFIPVRD